jgi:hypothetical protein
MVLNQCVVTMEFFMSFSAANIWATAQNKYYEFHSSSTTEKCYYVVSATEAVALTALQFYAPWAFALTTVSFSIINMVCLGKAITVCNSDQSDVLKTWAVIALNVTACALGIQALRMASHGFISGVGSLLKLKAHKSVVAFMLSTGALGFGIPAAQAFYERSLELLKTKKWVELETFMSSEKSDLGIFDKCALAIFFLCPEFAIALDFKVLARSDIFDFLPSEIKEKAFKRVVDQIVIRGDWATPVEHGECMGIFYMLPHDLKLKYYPLMHKLYKDSIKSTCEQVVADPLMPQDGLNDLIQFLDSLKERENQVTENYGSLLCEARTTLRMLKEEVRTIRAQGDANLKAHEEEIKAIAEKLTSLRQKTSEFMSSCRIYCPMLPLGTSSVSMNEEGVTEVDSYQKLSIDLINGEVQQELQLINSKLASAQEDADVIDLEEGMGNYILSNYAVEDRQGGLKLFAKMAKRFDLDATDLDGLDEALKKIDIDTVEKFIEAVFKGDKKGFSDADLVLEKLDAYLDALKQSKNDIRSQIYSALASSNVLQFMPSDINKTIAKVIYVSVMILATLSPISHQPALFVVALGGTVACNLAYSVAGEWIQTKIKNIWKFCLNFPEIRSLNSVIGTASRRPFVSLIVPTSRVDLELQTFISADFFTKMRLLSVELLYGSAVSWATIGDFPHSMSVGGAVSGIAIGNEVSDFLLAR